MYNLATSPERLEPPFARGGRIAKPAASLSPERSRIYRFANRLKTEAEAIRQLLELGLKAAGASKPASLGYRPNHPNMEGMPWGVAANLPKRMSNPFLAKRAPQLEEAARRQ